MEGGQWRRPRLVQICRYRGYVKRNPATGTYMRHNIFVKYYNKVVHQLDNLGWHSDLVPRLIEQFG